MSFSSCVGSSGSFGFSGFSSDASGSLRFSGFSGSFGSSTAGKTLHLSAEPADHHRRSVARPVGVGSARREQAIARCGES
jgi:hypothetical protein